MRELGLRGAVRGRAWTTTTQPTRPPTRPADLVDRALHGDAAESALGRGLHVRRDVARLRLRRVRHRRLRAAHRRLARLVVAARPTSCSMRSSRRSTTAAATTVGDLVHHSDRGTQYLSMRYTDRLADAGIEPSVGSRGDSYDNALAESVIGLFKTEVIRRQGTVAACSRPSNSRRSTWVDWFNHRRLLEPIGYVPPAEYEARYYEQAAGLTHITRSPRSRYDSRCPQRR